MNALPVEFLPGDRVIYIGRTPELKGLFGTVMVKPENPTYADPATFVFVHFDNDPTDASSRAWRKTEADMFLEHQPVTPGCWVRSVRAGSTDHHLHVTDIDGRWLWTSRNPTTHDRAEFTKLDPVYFVRIADPEPVAAIVPAPVELIAGQFLPGDRVFNHNGDLSTVIPTRPDQNGYVSLHIDRLPSTHGFANSFPESVKREPVKVGSFVRLHQPELNDFRYVGKVERIHDYAKTTVAIINGGGYFTSYLATVAEPETIQSADGNISMDLASGDFSIIVPDTVEPLATRLFMWSRVGSGSVEHCRDCELASQAIEEAASIFQTVKAPANWEGFPLVHEWLTKYAPNKLPKPPVFKRGDLVGVDRGDKMVPAKGRIVSPDGDRPIVEVVTKFGDFIMTDVDHIQHVNE